MRAVLLRTPGRPQPAPDARPWNTPRPPEQGRRSLAARGVGRRAGRQKPPSRRRERDPWDVRFRPGPRSRAHAPDACKPDATPLRPTHPRSARTRAAARGGVECPQPRGRRSRGRFRSQGRWRSGELRRLRGGPRSRPPSARPGSARPHMKTRTTSSLAILFVHNGGFTGAGLGKAPRGSPCGRA